MINDVVTWQEKAEWLRMHGYCLSIDALSSNGDKMKWKASAEGEGRRYAETIEGAIEQVYEWVTKGRE